MYIGYERLFICNDRVYIPHFTMYNDMYLGFAIHLL